MSPEIELQIAVCFYRPSARMSLPSPAFRAFHVKHENLDQACWQQRVQVVSQSQVYSLAYWNVSALLPPRELMIASPAIRVPAVSVGRIDRLLITLICLSFDVSYETHRRAKLQNRRALHVITVPEQPDEQMALSHFKSWIARKSPAPPSRYRAFVKRS